MPSDKTNAAFDAFRTGRPAKPLDAGRIANADQTRQMTEADGLLLWQDGNVEEDDAPGIGPPTFTAEQLANRMLWVVCQADVPYAPEACSFGQGLESRVIKHSNLTGGGAAYSGGEMLILDDKTIVINGCSGRYGPRSDVELSAAARAFKESGYAVWCMGFDLESGFPLPFVGSTPGRVE